MYNRASEVDKLKVLASGHPIASTGARSLFIEGLDPNFEPYPPRSTGSVKGKPPPVSAMSSEEVMVALRDTLLAGISSLNAIQNVT